MCGGPTQPPPISQRWCDSADQGEHLGLTHWPPAAQEKPLQVVRKVAQLESSWELNLPWSCTPALGPGTFHLSPGKRPGNAGFLKVLKLLTLQAADSHYQL